MNVPKLFRLTRHYTTHDGTVKTYEQQINLFDHVQNSLYKIIDECDHYTFDHHKLIAYKQDGSHLTVELRNQIKPCVIPIVEVIGESSKADNKCRCG